MLYVVVALLLGIAMSDNCADKTGPPSCSRVANDKCMWRGPPNEDCVENPDYAVKVPVDCDEYTCAVGVSYTTPEFTGSVTHTVSSCQDEYGWYSKAHGEMDDKSMYLWCNEQGFSRVGQVYRAAPTSDDELKGLPNDARLCTTEFLDESFTRVYSLISQTATWQCLDASPPGSQVADCCTNWTGSCYSRRTAKNNFHACMSCSEEPCEDACGSIHFGTGKGEKEDSEECRLCCQSVEHGDYHHEEWNCPAPAMTEPNAAFICQQQNGQGRRNCKDALHRGVGICHWNDKKGKCKLKRYYGGCANLTQRECRKALKRGRCDTNDGVVCFDESED